MLILSTDISLNFFPQKFLFFLNDWFVDFKLRTVIIINIVCIMYTNVFIIYCIVYMHNKFVIVKVDNIRNY